MVDSRTNCDAERGVLVLSSTDILSLNLKPEDYLRILEDAAKAHYEGRVVTPAKVALSSREGTYFHAMPALIKGGSIAGLKWVSAFPGNEGVPDSSATMLVSDANTGQLLGLFEGMVMTLARTAAMAALMVRYAAGVETTTLGVVGAGQFAQACATAIVAERRDIDTVKVFARRPSSRDGFVEAVQPATAGVGVHAVDSAELAVRDADIVLAVTTVGSPAHLNPAWLKPGAVALAMDGVLSWRPEMYEHVDSVVTEHLDYMENELRLHGLAIPRILEIGEVVAGQAKPREDVDGHVLCVSFGSALSDIAVASEILSRARASGIGTTVHL